MVIWRKNVPSPRLGSTTTSCFGSTGTEQSVTAKKGFLQKCHRTFIFENFQKMLVQPCYASCLRSTYDTVKANPWGKKKRKKEKKDSGHTMQSIHTVQIGQRSIKSDKNTTAFRKTAESVSRARPRPCFIGDGMTKRIKIQTRTHICLHLCMKITTEGRRRHLAVNHKRRRDWGRECRKRFPDTQIRFSSLPRPGYRADRTTVDAVSKERIGA